MPARYYGIKETEAKFDVVDYENKLPQKIVIDRLYSAWGRSPDGWYTIEAKVGKEKVEGTISDKAVLKLFKAIKPYKKGDK